MTPGEELLAIREKCAAEWEPGEWSREQLLGLGYESWAYLYEQTRPHWPYEWCGYVAKTGLEVVELIERAAVCALRDEGRL